MKMLTVEEAANNFSAVIRLVRRGEEVRLTSRKKAVAKIVPLKSKQLKKYNWSNTWAKVDAIFGGKNAPGKPASQIVIEGRR